MGCGCGSSFSGKTQKRCTCGRNKGGMCQCNDRKLNATGIDCLQDSDCRYRSTCVKGKCGGAYIFGDIYDYGAKQGGTKPPKYLKPYPTIGETYGVRQGQGSSPKAKSRKDKMMNFHHSKSNFSSKQVGFEDVRSRFNAFMGVTPQPQVDIKKYNIPQDEYYSYNDYYSGMGGAMSGGFKTQWNKNNDLEVEF